MEVSPNSRNVIPGLVKFTVDFRHVDGDALAAMAELFIKDSQAIAAAQGLEIVIDPAGAQPPVHFNPEICQLIRTASDESGYKHRDIASGAGHDAFHIAKVAPAAMIFCPCVDGLSHNEAETIFPEWAKAGADVLLQTLVTLARA
jgi:N-carbamoyl-L-amino-acid hydrolase